MKSSASMRLAASVGVSSPVFAAARSRLRVVVLIVSSSWLAVWILTQYRQSEHQALRIQYQRSLIREEKESSAHISELLPLMHSLLTELREALDQDPARKPGQEIVNRIVNLSEAMKPYRLWEKDSLSERSYSPERAQLLINLANLRIDSNAFLLFKQQLNFAKADLRGMNLSGLDLRNANLQGA